MAPSSRGHTSDDRFDPTRRSSSDGESLALSANAAAANQGGTNSNYNSARSRLASPPYEDRGVMGMDGLPLYASRTDLDAPPNSASPSGDSHPSSSSKAAMTDNNADRLASYAYPPEKVPSPQGGTSTSAAAPPRIAVTDPLHDMRINNLDRPEWGLSEKSDFPSRDRMMARDPSSTSAAGARPPTAGSASAGAAAGMPPRPTMVRHGSQASISTQSEYGYDDFDWSDDEGVEENLRAERAEAMAARKKRNRRLSPYKILRWLVLSFLGNFLLSAILVVPAIVLQFLYRNEGPESDRAHRDYVTDNVQAWTIWASFNLFMSWVFHILVELFPRFLLGAVALVWGRTNQTVLTAAEYYNAQKGYIKPLFYAACSWGSFAIIFNSIFHLYNHSDPENASRATYLYRIYQIIEFLFFVTLTICVEKIIIKNIALGFHKSAFAERITEVTKALETFDHLKDYRPKYKETSGTKSPFGIGRPHMASRSQSGLPFDATTPGSGSHSPVTPITGHDGDADDEGGAQAKRGFFGRNRHAKKRAQNADPSLSGHGAQGSYSSARGISPPNAGKAPARPATNIRGKPTKAMRSFKATASSASKLARIAMNDPLGVLQSDKAGSIATINSPQEAKKLAKTIFTSFRGRHHRSYLVLSDFEPAYPTLAEAREAFAVFDRDGNGDISQSEIKNTVLAVYKERRFLMKAIGDTNHAVSQLDLIMLIIAFILIMFEAFAIFNVDVSKTLTTFYTLGIAFAFIFKESAQNVFDSIVFIFVTHAMDTGDRIMIGDAVMVVTKMSLLSSQFTLADGTDMYVANSVLANLMITNFRRSGYQWENFMIQVDINTTLEQLDAVEADLCHWLSTEPDRLFEPSTALVPQTIEYMRYVEISVGMTHRANWQDWGARFARKNAFGAALTYYLKKHGVRYYQPTQPIHYSAEQVHAAQEQARVFAEERARERQAEAEAEGASPTSTSSANHGAYQGSQTHLHAEETYLLDDFDILPDSSGSGSGGAGASTAISPGAAPAKRANFMGFTPPADDSAKGVDDAGADEMAGAAGGEGARQRKVRNKGLTQQGGDG